MLDQSLFVSKKIHKREIELGDGSKHELYFRELPAGAMRQFSLDEGSEDEEERLNSMAALVSLGVVTKDGKRALTIEQANQLKAGVFMRIFNTLMEVSNATPKKTENGDSGTS